MGQKDSTEGKTYVLHATNLSLIPNTTHGP